MSKYRLEISQVVRDAIIHLPPQFKRKVKTALQSLSEDPYQAKALRDELEGLRSFRVARSRLILRVKRSTVEVVAFGPRKDIYERAATELSQTIRKGQKAR